MAKKKPIVGEKFKGRIEGLIKNDVISLKQKLEIIASILRKYESAKKRAEVYSAYLKKIVRNLMFRLKIDEHAYRRSFVKIIWDWSIKDEDKYDELYKNLVELIGKEKTEKMITITTTTPEPVKTYKLLPEAQKEISDLGLKEQVLEILGNTPKVVVESIPKRARLGKERKRKRA